MARFKKLHIQHHKKGIPGFTKESRSVVSEAPLSIEVADYGELTFIRTPGNDEDLITGFLLSEGLIKKASDITVFEVCPDDVNKIALAIASLPVGEASNHRFLMTASCGLCGVEQIEKLIESLPHLKTDLSIKTEMLYSLPENFRKKQLLFQETGGNHGSALFRENGEIVCVAEDVGRHNALDKVLGSALKQDLDFSTLGAFLSGRINLEMIVKCARAGISFVAGISAPSTLAIEIADKCGVTLLGFVRGNEAAVYAGDSVE